MATMRRFAAEVPWPVYCAQMPSGWRLQTLATDIGTTTRPTVLVQYERTDGAFFQIVQGNVCFVAGPGCRPTGTRLGEVRVAGQSGLLYRVGGVHMVWVGRSSEYPAWLFAGSDRLSEAEFKKLLSKVREVPE